VAFGRQSQNRGGTPIDGRLAIQARPCPLAWQQELCVCRRFASESFSFVLSVRHPWQAALANASTSICLLPLGTEHRIKSVVTVQNCGVA